MECIKIMVQGLRSGAEGLRRRDITPIMDIQIENKKSGTNGNWSVCKSSGTSLWIAWNDGTLKKMETWDYIVITQRTSSLIAYQR